MDKRLLLLIPSLLAILFVVILFGCSGEASLENPTGLPVAPQPETNPEATQMATALPFMPATRDPNLPQLSPTPDPPKVMPTARTEPEYYTIQSGDTLAKISARYTVPWTQVASANGIENPNLVEVGQVLTIPVPDPSNTGPEFKIIPDSELVNGPASAGFDIAGFIQSYNGYLAHYSENVEGVDLSGAQIVEEIVDFYSISPRLLLSVIEYQSGWITQPQPASAESPYPMGVLGATYPGFYYQLTWMANELNRGFYLWRAGGVSHWILADNNVVPISPTINAGTAGVQNLMARFYPFDQWQQAVSTTGVYAVYQAFFGYPFDLAIEPLIPADLSQPALRLPIEDGAIWSFTGGPHGGWADGSGWAALDFAPPGEPMGCVTSDAWVVASADGWIVRAGGGAVIQELDGDGLEQTGWTVLYMHIATTDDRVQTGQYVTAGDRIGHPSCEGGFSNGTHLHFARRYNGEWIPADGSLPFNLEGWISSGTGIEYDGYLTRNEKTLEAWDGRTEENQIQR